MDWSIGGASAQAHLKIVAIALLAAIAVVWGRLAAHMSTAQRDIPMSHSISSR